MGVWGTVELLAVELDLEARLPRRITQTHAEDRCAGPLLPPSAPLPLNFNLWICLPWPDRLKISPKGFQPWCGLPPH